MWGFPQAEGKAQHPGDREQARRWVEELDKYGIRAIGFVTGGGNDHLSEVCSWYPDRFVGFAHHSPFLPDAVERLEQAVKDLGLRAYKLLAPNIEEPIEDPPGLSRLGKMRRTGHPGADPLWHPGRGGRHSLAREYQPAQAAQCGQSIPGSDLCHPHFGCAWERETLQLCWACPNVSVDTCGSNQWIRWVPGEVTVKYLFRKYYETIGPERIIFGTDSSWFPRGFAFRYLQDQLRDCLDLNMPDEHIQMIFAGNAARLLKIAHVTHCRLAPALCRFGSHQGSFCTP
jgi:predicted TIM-barrel fold metal-dependent hydrolase